jgi:hypothetical protein
MQEAPVMLQCTKLYLDERPFYEQARSKDYFQTHGEVMKPGLQNRRTVQLGSPTVEVVDKIYAAMLKEQEEPLHESGFLWRRPEIKPQTPYFSPWVLLELLIKPPKLLPDSLHQASTISGTFAHPLRSGRIQVLSLQSVLPDEWMLRVLAAFPIDRIEIHCETSDYEAIQNAVKSTSNHYQTVVKEIWRGSLIHRNAHEVVEKWCMKGNELN